MPFMAYRKLYLDNFPRNFYIQSAIANMVRACKKSTEDRSLGKILS